MAPAFNIRSAVGLLLSTAAAILCRPPSVTGEESSNEMVGTVSFGGTEDWWSNVQLRKLALHKDMDEVVLNLKAATRTVSMNNALR